jgi:hypothetical protein
MLFVQDPTEFNSFPIINGTKIIRIGKLNSEQNPGDVPKQAVQE